MNSNVETVLTLPAAAFVISGRGVAVLTGISSGRACPFERGDEVLIKTCKEREIKSSVLAVEHVLMGDRTEQYGLVFSGLEECVAELVAGTKIFLVTDAPAPLPSTSE